jgi:SAM-dependent methyltransferase
VGEFRDHFSKLAASYADFRPHYPPELFSYLASVAPAREAAWDCACGNGQASIDLAEHFGRVIATDASVKQIDSAKAHPKIDYRVAPAYASGLADQSVDLVTVAQALHWFDRDAFYAEAKRVLRPKGVLAVWCYGVSKLEDPAADELFQDFYANRVGDYWPPERRIVEEGYRTIEFPFAEVTPPEFKMQTHWSLPDLLGYLSSWSGVQRFTEARGESPLPQLEAQLLLVWGDPARKMRIDWPLSLRLGF